MLVLTRRLNEQLVVSRKECRPVRDLTRAFADAL